MHRLVAEVLVELGLRERTVGIAPVGCAVLAYDYFNCDMFEVAHGRAPAVATGAKRARPDRIVFTYPGDGARTEASGEGGAAAGEDAGASPRLGGSDYSLDYASVDSSIAPMVDHAVQDGMATIRDFFGLPFRVPVQVRILPDRDGFNRAFPSECNMKETPCRVVAVGARATLWLLTPMVWTEQACEHDPADTVHVRNLITHELVHAFHGQHAGAPDFSTLQPLAWFVEGLAVYVSGQLDEGRLPAAREALEKGGAPGTLADAWTGEYRDTLSGSLVRYIDETYGREAIKKMLAATTTEQILEATGGTTEADLLDGWKAWVQKETS